MDKQSTYFTGEEPTSNEEDESEGRHSYHVLQRARLRIKRAWQQLGIWGPHFEHLMTAGAGTSTQNSSWILPPEHESREELFHRSRPINIFRHQVLNAGKMLLDEMPTRRGRHMNAAGDFSDIRPVAYRLVRSQWEERGIWLDCWGELPGGLWGHEIPTEQWYRDAAPGERQSQSLPRTEGKGNIMATYRRRLRNIKRRVRWAPVEGGLDVDLISEDDASNSSSTDSCESLVTRASDLSWKVHVNMMQRQEMMAFQVSRAELIAEESDIQTMQGLPALDSELEKQAQPLVECEVKSLVEEVAEDHDAPMCLGSDCVVHDLVLEDRDAETFAKVRMPGIFPGDLEQYITF
ncbi:hypothetical protein LQW54_009552 [Pestalotiopsis sp. IQ-011]